MADNARSGLRISPFLAASVGLHGVGLAALLAVPRAWELVLGALIANHLGIGVAGMLPRCGWLGPNVTRLPALRTGGDLVALTFDDGPDPEVTPAVLEILEAAQARATFFCIGKRVEANTGLTAAIRARGHGVENHTYSHPNGFALRGPRAMAWQIGRAQEAIEQCGGGRPSFFRAPAGIQNAWLATVLAGAGLTLVSWSRRGYDTLGTDGARVAARLVRRLRSGDILVLHDGSSACDPSGRPLVLDALPRVIDQMERMGLRSEALHRVLAPDDGRQ